LNHQGTKFTKKTKNNKNLIYAVLTLLVFVLLGELVYALSQRLMGGALHGSKRFLIFTAFLPCRGRQNKRPA
jgi:hypothetical protein